MEVEETRANVETYPMWCDVMVHKDESLRASSSSAIEEIQGKRKKKSKTKLGGFLGMNIWNLQEEILKEIDCARQGNRSQESAKKIRKKK